MKHMLKPCKNSGIFNIIRKSFSSAQTHYISSIFVTINIRKVPQHRRHLLPSTFLCVYWTIHDGINYDPHYKRLLQTNKYISNERRIMKEAEKNKRFNSKLETLLCHIKSKWHQAVR